MSEQQEFPSQFTHSVKITDTAKGIRIDVHAWANDQQTAISEAFTLYQRSRRLAEESKIPLAPIEIKEMKNGST